MRGAGCCPVCLKGSSKLRRRWTHCIRKREGKSWSFHLRWEGQRLELSLTLAAECARNIASLEFAPADSTQSGKSDIHIDAWLEQRQKSAGPLFPANLLLETCFSFARFSWHIASEPWSMGAAR